MRIVKTDARWFDIPNDPDGGRLKIKSLSPGETSDIFDKVFTQEVSYKKGKKGKWSHRFHKTPTRHLTVK